MLTMVQRLQNGGVRGRNEIARDRIVMPLSLIFRRSRLLIIHRFKKSVSRNSSTIPPKHGPLVLGSTITCSGMILRIILRRVILLLRILPSEVLAASSLSSRNSFGINYSVFSRSAIWLILGTMNDLIRKDICGE